MGFRGQVVRSTLADAIEQRDWSIHADWAQAPIRRARKLDVGELFAHGLFQNLEDLDARVIDLCPSLFPLVNYRSSKAAIKLHTLLDLRGSIPTFVGLSGGGGGGGSTT